MFYFWRGATAALVPGFLCQSGRRRPENVSILSSLLAPTTATVGKTALLKWIRVFSNFVAFIQSVGVFPGNQFLGDF